jgi:hypothetical protein
MIVARIGCYEVSDFSGSNLANVYAAQHKKKDKCHL